MLSKATREALTYLLEHADSMADDDHGDVWEDSATRDGWIETRIGLAMCVADDWLYEDAWRDMEDAALHPDCPPSQRKAIIADLCRCGYYEAFDPRSVYSRKPRTTMVDGNRYVTG